MKPESSQFIENESTSFVCILNGMDKFQIKNITWYKNDNLINEINLENAKIDYENMRLKLADLSHLKDNGIYYCVVELKNSQSVVSNKLEIEKKFKNYFNI